MQRLLFRRCGIKCVSLDTTEALRATSQRFKSGVALRENTAAAP